MKHLVLLLTMVLVSSISAAKPLKVVDLGIYGPTKGIVLIELTILVKSQLKTYTIKTTQDDMENYNTGKDSFIYKAIEKLRNED